jgi:O-acetyl-ADP-ribose deacetylase (regulator of RNase III)
MSYFSERYNDHSAYYAEQAARRKQEHDAAVASQAVIDALPTPDQRRESNRLRYKCGDNFLTAAMIPTWTAYSQEVKLLTMLRQQEQHQQQQQHRHDATAPPQADSTSVPSAALTSALDAQRSTLSFHHNTSFSPSPPRVSQVDVLRRFPVAPALNEKVSLFQGDITALEVDAVVNAANESLLGGGGIDGAIHSAAGPLMLEECKGLHGCPTGETRMTKGYKLPAAHVLHTVGPIGRGDGYLVSCYATCLELVLEHQLRTVAFCCVGTGIFGFPLVRAAHIALYTVRTFLEKHTDCVDRIVFCVFRSEELDVYQKLLPSYFPVQDGDGGAACPDDKLLMFDPNDKPQFQAY